MFVADMLSCSIRCWVRFCVSIEWRKFDTLYQSDSVSLSHSFFSGNQSLNPSAHIHIKSICKIIFISCMKFDILNEWIARGNFVFDVRSIKLNFMRDGLSFRNLWILVSFIIRCESNRLCISHIFTRSTSFWTKPTQCGLRFLYPDHKSDCSNTHFHMRQ